MLTACALRLIKEMQAKLACVRILSAGVRPPSKLFATYVSVFEFESTSLFWADPIHDGRELVFLLVSPFSCCAQSRVAVSSVFVSVYVGKT